MAEKKFTWRGPDGKCIPLAPLPKSVIPKEAFEVGEPNKCGLIEFAEGDIEINVGRPTKEITMVNTGDRAIQIGAHCHLAECNKAMALDREAAFGMHLDIPAGTSIRFEPGQSQKVRITTYQGQQAIFGMNNITNGTTRSEFIRKQAMDKLRAEGFCFEGERYPVVTRCDEKYVSKKKK